MNSTTVFAYPIQLKMTSNDAFNFEANQTEWFHEIFVTFVEPNFFHEPYQSIEVKNAAFFMWLCGLVGNFFQNLGF